MPKIEKHTKIENGVVLGTVEIDTAEATFEICSVEEWEKLSEEKAEQLAFEALFESGKFEWYY